MVNKLHRFLQGYGCLMMLIVFVASCKPTVPSDYLQPDEMEDVLYDYHIAMNMAQQDTHTPVMQKVYKDAVLKKYGITNDQFEQSLQYYMRHTRMLKGIYEDITKRYEHEARLLGVSENDLTQYGTLNSKGDTTDLWQSSKTLILSPYALVNQKSFSIQADTTFHKGDRFVFSFDAQYMVQEGVRDALALLAVTFSNDSTVTQSQHIYGGGRQTIMVENNDTLGIKAVKGFFLLLNGQQPTTTFKMLILQNIRLVRVHQQKTSDKGMRGDSVRQNDPIRTIGGAPVSKPNTNLSNPAMTPTPPGHQGVPVNESQRTLQKAIDERGIPPRR